MVMVAEDLCVSFFRITTVVAVTRDLETIATGFRATAAARMMPQLKAIVYQKCLANSEVYSANCLANLPRYCVNLAIMASGYSGVSKVLHLLTTAALLVVNQAVCSV